jgi:hypothetical protein
MQLRSAAAQGATTVVVTSTELCRSIRMGSYSSQNCCEAMQTEIKPGDIVLDQSSGTGMTVLLSVAAHRTITLYLERIATLGAGCVSCPT